MKIEEYIKKRKQCLLEENNLLHLQMESLRSEQEAVASYLRQSEQSVDIGYELFSASGGSESVRERRNELHSQLEHLDEQIREIEQRKKEIQSELQEIEEVEEEIHTILQQS